jgi:hypothetical protein
MAISVTDPIGRALDRTKHVLFKPFHLRKWFVLGFCAFLAQLGEGGGGGGANFTSNLPRGGPGAVTTPAPPPRITPGVPLPGPAPQPPPTPSPADWISANLHWLIPVAVVLLAVVIALSLVVIWLHSRGKFMFLDGIVRNRGAVVEPWREFRELGNSLFRFKIVFGLISLLVLALIGALGVGLAWPDIQAGQFRESAVVALVVGIPLLLVASLSVSVIALLLEDFVVPAMYQRRARVMECWSVVRHEVLGGRTGTIILFCLMKIVLGIAIAIIALLLVCATCCLAAIPYLGTVIMLPMFVFTRCYSLCFLEQLGPPWQFFPVEGLYCARCGYNLWQNTSGVCPGCGTPIVPEHPPVVRPPGAPLGP